jgi:hypothetical protein
MLCEYLLTHFPELPEFLGEFRERGGQDGELAVDSGGGIDVRLMRVTGGDGRY